MTASAKKEALAAAGILVVVGLAAVIAFAMAPSESEIDVQLGIDSTISVDMTSVPADVGALIADLGHHADRYTITVVSLGTASAGYQPREVGQLAGERQALALEGPQAPVDRTAEVVAITEKLKVIPETAIFATLDALLRDARTRRCDDHRRCVILMRTDGLEEKDAAIRARLSGKKTAEAPPRLRNDNVEVVFCGLSLRTKSRGAGPSLATIEDAWRVEFSVPSAVSFRPFCRDLISR